MFENLELQFLAELSSVRGVVIRCSGTAPARMNLMFWGECVVVSHRTSVDIYCTLQSQILAYVLEYMTQIRIVTVYCHLNKSNCHVCSDQLRKKALHSKKRWVIFSTQMLGWDRWVRTLGCFNPILGWKLVFIITQRRWVGNADLKESTHVTSTSDDTSARSRHFLCLKEARSEWKTLR